MLQVDVEGTGRGRVKKGTKLPQKLSFLLNCFYHRELFVMLSLVDIVEVGDRWKLGNHLRTILLIVSHTSDQPKIFKGRKSLDNREKSLDKELVTNDVEGLQGVYNRRAPGESFNARYHFRSMFLIFEINGLLSYAIEYATRSITFNDSQTFQLISDASWVSHGKA
jgi:hypothetical protein